MKYELRQFDTALLKFSTSKQEFGELSFSIDWINEEKRFLFPIGMEISPKGLEKWLSSRVIPKNREFVDQILARSGLSHNDTMGIINICKGLSLNDSYWVVEDGFNGSFKKYNLYKNNFTRILSLIAYTGYGSNTKKDFTSSPEFTTNGMLKKCWRRQNGKVYLYKGGTFGAANTGKEPYSEYYASQIAEKMGLNHIEYNLKKWKNEICSTCEIFTSENVSYVPIYKILKECNLNEVRIYLKNLGENYYNKFADMLVFDAIIFNTDRHFGNFGLIVNNTTNKPIDFAPIFDNGLSLFNYAMEADLKDLDNYSKTRLPAYNGVTFDDILKEMLSERQKSQVRKLINFKFKKHPRYNLDKKRLNLIEKFIQKRIQYILNLNIKK